MAGIRICDSSGQGKAELSFELTITKKEISPRTFSVAVRTLLQNWRQGTVGCKDRGEVAFSNKKPWKQKGTGRARAGSLRSPLWRKGGVTFGPQARVRGLSINKKQKKGVYNNLFFNAFDNDSIYCLDADFSSQKPNTKQVFNFLKTAGLTDKKLLVFLPFNDEISHASFRNIPNVNILYFDQPNAFDLSNSNGWVFLKRDVNLFKEMVERWN